METKTLIILIILVSLAIGGFFICKNIFFSEEEKEATEKVEKEVGEEVKKEAEEEESSPVPVAEEGNKETKEKETKSVPPLVSGDIKITDILWRHKEQIAEISLNRFPSNWGDWKMYVDGKEIPMEGGVGNPAARPNASLDQNPTGLIIGALPWVSSLAETDFPCCGTIQFYIPGQGLTNKYEFNWVDFDCDTASGKECPSEWVRHYGDLVIEGTETEVIEDVKYFQEGNIYVNDQAKLVIKNSQLMMGRGNVPTVHVYIFVSPGASLEIDNSRIFPHSGLVCVMNQGKTDIIDSPVERIMASLSCSKKVAQNIIDSALKVS